jgi:hypothetical protein
MKSAKLRRSRDVSEGTPSERGQRVESAAQPTPSERGQRCDSSPISNPAPIIETNPPASKAHQTHPPQTGSKHDGGFIFRSRDRSALEYHLIIHWGGTLAGDDPDGKLFAKLRFSTSVSIANTAFH